MSPADILHEMREIKEQWRRDTFQASPEVRARYYGTEAYAFRHASSNLLRRVVVIEPGTMQS